MKIILIIRHAKAESVISLNDFERPLNERGKKDAIAMAKRIMDKKLKIDAFVSSPAKRAKKTAQLFCETFDGNEQDIILLSKLYQAPAAVYFEVIEQLNDDLNTVAIFGHNPGITDFANELSTIVQVDNIPTCGVFAIKADNTHWSGFTKTKKEFLFFDYPKKL